jgi:streptogramin lyase
VSRLARIGLYCALAAGCESGDDVVARLAGPLSNDAGPSDVPDASTEAPACCGDAAALPFDAGTEAPACCGDAATPPSPVSQAGVPEGVACVSDGTLMYLLSKTGALFRVRSEQGSIEPLGVPECLTPSGVFVAAVDLAGQLWVVPDDSIVRVIDPVSRVCKKLDLAIKASAMAFLHDTNFQKSMLYAVEAGALYVIDPASRTRVPIGPLTGGPTLKSLAGTAAGELFAFAQDGDSVVTIGRVDLGNASVNWQWKAPQPGAFVGGVAWSDDFGLVFQSELYRLRTSSGETQLVAKLVTDDSGFFSVAPSPCMVASTK